MSEPQGIKLPDHWTTAKISDLCEFIVDCIHDTPELSESPTGYFMIRTSDVGNGHVRLENARFVSEEVYEHRIQRGKPQWEDIVISREAPLGNVGQILTNKNICLGQRLIHYRPNKKVDPRYLLFALLSPMVQQEFRANEGRGSIVDNLLMQTAKDLLIPVPPFAEQQKIAAVLSALDRKIELNQRINAELEAMAKTLYDYWFVQYDFPNEKGKPYKSSGGKMVWNAELKREIPQGWGKGVLSDIGTITGGSTPPREVEEYFDVNGTPWITPKDLSLNTGNKFVTRGETGISEEGIKAASLTIMPKGTVLLSSRAPIGYMAIAREKVTTNQGFKSFIPDKGYSIPYIYYTVKNAIPTIVNHSSGSTFKEASATVLKSISICLAPTILTEKFQKTVDAVFERQNKLEIESQTLAELRDWLLPMLMNGQVKVN